MERHEHIIPHVIRFEGGLSRDTKDSASSNPCPVPHKGLSGWHTNKGITWTTWMSYCKAKGVENVDERARLFYAMTEKDVSDVWKILYWDRVRANIVENVAIANTITQWAWGSGSAGAWSLVHNYCKSKGVKVSSWTESNNWFNKQDPKILFAELCKVRRKFFHDICELRPANQKFLKGWLNRLEDFIEFNQKFL